MVLKSTNQSINQLANQQPVWSVYRQIARFWEELLLPGAVMSGASQGTLVTNKPTKKLAILMRMMRRRLEAPLLKNYNFDVNREKSFLKVFLTAINEK